MSNKLSPKLTYMDRDVYIYIYMGGYAYQSYIYMYI